MNLNGTWYNELGSVMELAVNGKMITGIYHTAVGNAAGDYDLIGQVDTDNDQSQAIGFVVIWNNSYGSSDSVTAWSGQAQIINGNDTIVTTWLLTSETDVDDDWHSTIINKDIFLRTAVSKEKVSENFSLGFKESFPKSIKDRL